jgi:hypothetical protein
MVKFDWSKYFNVQGAIAIITALAMIVGSVLGVHAYFAKEKEFVSFKTYIESRVAGAYVTQQIYETSTQKSSIQSDIWKTEDRIQQKPSDTAARQRLRELELEKQKLDQREQELKAEKLRLDTQQKKDK